MELLRIGMLSLALSCVFTIGGVRVTAQSPQTASSSQARGVTCRLGAEDGARRFRPGAWGLVEFVVENRTDEPVEAEAALQFIDDPTLQYGRRAAVPARSILRTTCPVLVPDFMSSTVRYVDFLTEQTEPPPSADVKRPSPSEAIMSSLPMVLDHESTTLAMISELHETRPPPGYVPFHTSGPRSTSPLDYPIYEMMLAAKRARELSRRISVFDAEDLPLAAGCLDAIDVLLLSSDRLAGDPGGIAIVRDWVLSGGNLWMMLDEVNQDTVAAVLGDAVAITYIDRVGMTRVTLENARPVPEYSDTGELEFEEPVEFVRVIPEGVTVTDRVDGWPASFWQPFGAGRVYFTTLGPAAWMRPSTPLDPPPQSRIDETQFYPREPLVALANECIEPRKASEFEASLLQPFLTEQIGYRILSWQAVTAILGTSCLTILAAGLWFFGRGRAERLLWFAPLVAAVTSLVLLAIGTTNKRSVPPTVATIARVVLEPGVAAGRAFGLAAMYNQDACDDLLGATRGGIFFPDMTAMSGRRRRLIWTDEGAWHWAALELPAGVRTAPFEYPLHLKQAAECRAQFGPDGLQGCLGPLPFSALENVIIAVPHQSALSVKIDKDGSFVSGVDDVLAAGEFVQETWLSDQQRRRKAVYQQLLRTGPELESLTRPSLFAWTGALDTAFVFPQDNQLGSTLLSIPLRFEKTRPGTEVSIPAPFIPYRAVHAPDGRAPSAYANLLHAWVESKLAVTDHVRFQLPRTVLPIQLSLATISLTVRAPSRTVEILVPTPDGPQVVMTRSHPIGTFSTVVNRPELLQLDAEGGLLLAVRVSDDETANPLDQMTLALWNIQKLELEVTGTVQGE